MANEQVEGPIDDGPVWPNGCEGEEVPTGRSRREFLTLTAGAALAVGAASAQERADEPIAGEEASLGWDATVAGNIWTLVDAPGGGYALAGGTASDPTQSNCLLVTLTSGGDVDRRREYDLGGVLYPVISLPDGYVAAQLAVVGEQTHVRVLRLDADGSVTATGPQLGGEQSDQFYDVVQTAGGVVLCGWTYSHTDSEGHDLWLVKVTEEGEPEWSRTFGTEPSFYANAMVGTDDGFLLVGGRWYENAARDGMVLKTDRQGREQWRRTIGGDGTDSLHSVAQLGDHVVVGGRTTDAEGASRGVIFRLDPGGNTVWSETITDGGASTIRAVQAVGTSGVVAAGQVVREDATSAQVSQRVGPVGGGVSGVGGRATSRSQVASGQSEEALFVTLDAEATVTSTASASGGTQVHDIVLAGSETAAFVGSPPDATGTESWAGTLEHGIASDDDGGRTENREDETEPDVEDGDPPDDGGPGFGLPTGLAGLGGAAYLIGRRFDDEADGAE